MAEVNGAYKRGRYESVWMKGLRVTFNVKVVAAQDGRQDGRSAGYNAMCYLNNKKKEKRKEEIAKNQLKTTHCIRTETPLETT